MTALTKAGAEREAVFSALLAEMQHHRLSQTEFIEQLMGQVRNHVLLVELVVFPPDGKVMREFGVPIGSVAVANHSTTATVTVQSSAGGDVAPTQGVGCTRVNKATGAVFALLGHAVTLYGTPGETASLQVYTKVQAPAFGPA